MTDSPPRRAAPWSTSRTCPRRPEGLALDHDDDRDAPHGPESTGSRVRGRTPDGGGAAADGPDELDGLLAAIASARAGDEDGFATLWRALHPRLLRYLTARGDEAPEDLAAETWLAVMRGLPAFEGGVNEFRGWLFTIARNRAIDQGRARGRRVRTLSVADPSQVGTPEMTPSAEAYAVENDATGRALRLVATLPAAQAEMVMLRVVAGLDVADVAQMLDKKPGTVRVTVHRALRALARDPQVRSAREVV